MKILLVSSSEAIEKARLLCARINAAGLDAVVQPHDRRDVPIVDVDEIGLVIPMGGDGTFLGAARLIDFAPIPILGFNHGTLGFLCGSPSRDEMELVVACLAGELPLERRGTLDAAIVDGDGIVHEVTALNEIVYARGASGHVVQYAYAINGVPVASLDADGLVVSTATGSTAYALSAGGPIVSPGYMGLVIVPIAPHTLNARAMVTAPSDVVEVRTFGRSVHESALFVDGNSLDIPSPSSILVHRGEREVLFASGGADFFTNVSQTFYGGFAGAFDD